MEVLDKQTILKELASNGFYILENYYTENQCDEILNHISAKPGYLFEQGQGGRGSDTLYTLNKLTTEDLEYLYLVKTGKDGI